MSGHRPPRLAVWLHERSLGREDREAVIGDLLEGFASRAIRDPRLARQWVWLQTLRSLAPNLHRRWFVQRPAASEPLPQGGRIVNGLSTDLRFALRLFRRQPLTSIVAFVSLTAALTLNVLLATLADAALLRQLPLRSPGELVLVLLQRETHINHNFSYLEYGDLRDRARGLESLVAYSGVGATVDGPAGATPVNGEVVSGNFFGALGIRIRTGRALGDADDRADAPRAVVLSDRLARERFGGDDPLGRVLRLHGEGYTVVGVADGGFTGMQVGQRASFWIPLAHAAPLTGGDRLRRPASWLTVVGRLRDGVDRAAARDELDAILRSVRAEAKQPMEPVVLTAGGRGDSNLAAQLSSPLRLLMLAGAVVLLVACLNVANLQLARTAERQTELTIRAALGARRDQLVRLVAIDGCLLAAAAGAAAVAMAALLKDAAVSMIAFYGQPVALDVPLDLRTLGAAAALSVLAGVSIALLTMLPIVRRRPGVVGASRTASSARPALQRGLVALQIALSMALVTGAALLVRTVDQLRRADLGFDPRGVAVVQVSPAMGRVIRAQSGAYFDEVIRAVESLPGVKGAGVAHVMPLDFGGSRMTIDVAGYKPAPDEEMELNFARVSPGYFSAMDIPLLQGRGFDDRDRDGQPERIVVNETMAKRFWPDGRAVGGLVRTNSRDPYAVEVIGVVPDVHYRMVREEPRPSFYVPLAQYPAGGGVVHVRFAGASAAAARIDELRRVVGAVNPAVPVERAHTLLDQVERNIADERMATALVVALAAVALVLATAGIYATMAFVVGRRTREIGVRMALGARAADMRALVLREGFVLAAIGVAGGVALSMWTGKALDSLLFGVGRADAISLAAAAGFLAAAALLASWIPARRAARVDPVVALRSE